MRGEETLLRTLLTLVTAEFAHKPLIRPRERGSSGLELGGKSNRIDQLPTAQAKVFITRDGRGRIVNAR